MYKVFSTSLILTGLLFVGCSTTEPKKEEVAKKEEVVKKPDIYSIVIEKSIKDCKTHNIMLDEKRTTEFLQKSPRVTIEKAAKQTEPTPKKLCEFFAEETSVEKIEQVDAFTNKIMDACEKLGVTLAKEKIHKTITTLPFFVIKKGLAMQNETSVEECQLMQKKYQ